MIDIARQLKVIHREVGKRPIQSAEASLAHFAPDLNATENQEQPRR
jgi:hypothetical protein